MEPAPEYVPEQHEVETQLARMLESDEFASSPRLSDLLRYIVGATLPDKEGKIDPVMLTEYQIGFKVFKEAYDPKGSAVRVNATYLRDHLRKYYANSGSRDRVKIEVPSGGYRAVFSYNRSSPAGKLYQRACSLIAGFVPSEHEHGSLSLFREAIDADPDYAPPHAALAEAELKEAMYRRSIPPHDPVAAAGSSALKALRLERRLWRAHVALASVRCCRRQWDRADRSFDKAVALAPNAKRDHLWYAGFLLAIGGRRQEMEALRLARARAEAKPEDLSAQVALGFFLYLVRQFDEADEFLSETAARFPKSWLARIVLACVDLAKDNAVEALVSIEQAHRIQDEQLDRGSFRDNVFPGLYHLCNLRYYGESERQRSRESIEKAIGLDHTAVYAMRHGAGEINAGELYEDWDPGHFDTYIPYWTPLQLALALMGLGEKESAIAALTRAVHEGDPLTIFLRRLPLFDELRGDGAFKSLIDGMNFPR